MTPTKPTSNLPALAAALLLFSGCAADSTYEVEQDVMSARVVPAGSVLIVLSTAPQQVLTNGKQRDTGYFLNEFYEPYLALTNAGYDVSIATVGGETPSLDPESLEPGYWKSDPTKLAVAKAFVESHPQMLEPLRLDEVDTDNYQALIVPGGQGVMVDLLDNRALHNAIRAFAANDRPVGLICHAPAILARMGRVPASFEGRRVTSVSATEEWYIEKMIMKGNAQVRKIGELLEDAGFRHRAAFPGRSNAVRDCNLVTNQNPYSSDAFNELFVNALADWRAGGRCVPQRRG